MPSLDLGQPRCTRPEREMLAKGQRSECSKQRMLHLGCKEPSTVGGGRIRSAIACGRASRTSCRTCRGNIPRRSRGIGH